MPSKLPAACSERIRRVRNRHPQRAPDGRDLGGEGGVYKGRPPSIKPDAVSALKAEGLGATEIAKRLKIGRASVYRMLDA
jgi:DNA invertase Pin-like site-specific DNA recombinase